ncbi:beta-ketoacyl synthase N-terminal-like domain-containing protein, partial [Nonomuraea sp. NPDC003201]
MIALIGIGCRLPGGVGSAEEYWNLLCEGRDASGRAPADRWRDY